jgi:hypothetical protein
LLSGGIFQALGTLKTTSSIYNIATKIFNKNPIENWIKNFPRINPKPNTGPMISAGQESTAYVAERLHIIEDDKNYSIEDRIDALALNHKNTERIVNYLCEEREEHEFLHATQEKKVKNKIFEVEREIGSKLEKLHLSDFVPTIIGLLWITVGVIMATIGSL